MPINLMPEQGDRLPRIARGRETPPSLMRRAWMILQAAEGRQNKTMAGTPGGLRRDRRLLAETLAERPGRVGQGGGTPQTLGREGGLLVADRLRSGSPGTFSAEQVCPIIASAGETPPEHLSHWTSTRTWPGRRSPGGSRQPFANRPSVVFLNQADLKPRRVRYWLDPEVDDEVTNRFVQGDAGAGHRARSDCERRSGQRQPVPKPLADTHYSTGWWFNAPPA